MTKQKFIEDILADYDLVETDKDCLNNISGALLEATQYRKKPAIKVSHIGEDYCVITIDGTEYEIHSAGFGEALLEALKTA